MPRSQPSIRLVRLQKSHVDAGVSSPASTTGEPQSRVAATSPGSKHVALRQSRPGSTKEESTQQAGKDGTTFTAEELVTSMMPHKTGLEVRECAVWLLRALLLATTLLVILRLTGIAGRIEAYTNLPILYSPHIPPSPPRSNNGSGLPTPAEWLEKHSDPFYHEAATSRSARSRPKAAIISLVRDEELGGILQSIRQLQLRWNDNYSYPWLFFSETPFTDTFIVATGNATSGLTEYHLIPSEHWLPHPERYPERNTSYHVHIPSYHSSLGTLGVASIGKGNMPSYRSMCRWNSAFFYLHHALADYDYYWRVEPDVHFFCKIPYDPFRLLRDTGTIYGFNMAILDDGRSFASLWDRTKEFWHKYQEEKSINTPDTSPDEEEPTDIDWLLYTGPDAEEGQLGTYNTCQFFSNFEIASLNFFRSPLNRAYVEYLDSPAVSGFWLERYGDAPVHTLSLALFAGGKDKIHYFGDIGYQHDQARVCPMEGVRRGQCDCEATTVDENFYKLVPMESPQRRPLHSCLRRWLGGEWTETKSGWRREDELRVGGDGLGGYVRYH